MSAIFPFHQSLEDPVAREARELNSLAVRGLMAMFDGDRRLFCHRIERENSGFSRQGISQRYSAMALLGLHELQEMGSRLPIDIDAAVASVVQDDRWMEGLGDFGLGLWLASRCMPAKIEALFRTIEPDVCLDEFTDAGEGRTMELAWFLAGLCHSRRALVKSSFPLEDFAAETFRRLCENRTKSGLFRHTSGKNSWSGCLRASIGTLADQIFAIYAMSLFAVTFDLEESLEPALECAERLCNLQGCLGQWWWLYHAEKGEVLSRYPVFAVHQHGLVPLALRSLEEASGRRFQDFADRGLHWIYGANELSEDLRCSSESLIWRCIRPRNQRAKYLDVARCVLGWPPMEMPPATLQVAYESRPFELGLILYSSAKFGLPDLSEKSSCSRFRAETGKP